MRNPLGNLGVVLGSRLKLQSNYLPPRRAFTNTKPWTFVRRSPNPNSWPSFFTCVPALFIFAAVIWPSSEVSESHDTSAQSEEKSEEHSTCYIHLHILTQVVQQDFALIQGRTVLTSTFFFLNLDSALLDRLKKMRLLGRRNNTVSVRTKMLTCRCNNLATPVEKVREEQ